MSLFIPITKVDAAKRLVYGTITEEVPDVAGEVFDYETGKEAIKTWSDEIRESTGGKSLGNVRAMHDKIAAGKFTDISYDDANKRIEGVAKIVDEAEWEKVLEGVYTGFSIGGGYAKRWTDPKNPNLTRYTPVLHEVSIVDLPCVPTATFECIKADGTSELRKFKTNEEPMKTAETGSDNAAVDNNATAVADAAKPELVKDGKPVKPKAAPVQKWVANDGNQFDTKREAEVHNLTLEKQAELAPGLSAMEDLLKDAAAKPADAPTEEQKPAEPVAVEEPKEPEAQATTDADANKAAGENDTLAKKDYSEDDRKEMADSGEAMADGSFPIKTKKDVENAVHDWGRAGSKASVKRHIISRAKAVGAEDALPDDWNKTKKAIFSDLKKGLGEAYDVNSALNALISIEYLLMSEEFEAEEGEDEDGQVAMLQEALSQLRQFIASEIMEDETEEGAEKLAKRGAKFSAKTKEALMAVHKSANDHAENVGKCMKDMGIIEEDEGAEGKQNQKMSKVLDTLNQKSDEVLALTKVVAQANEALLKVVPVIQELQKKDSENRARIEHLERQPMPGKGNVRTVSKTQDSGESSNGDTEAEYLGKLNNMSENERAKELMKLALKFPVQVVR